jgi:AraC family transcriptional regulator, regulatory protein of adaptative response / DNA-3-methyladenine glycosylase II
MSVFDHRRGGRRGKLTAMVDRDRQLWDRARQSRDARFDGRFFIAVTSTRIYCRPICPVRPPKDQNIRYYPSAAAAEAAGFRPCLRCRPEASPGTPAWLGTSGVVSRALRLIADGELDEGGVEDLADRLGITARHLRRLFLQHLGATPLQVALTRRVHFAKKLLDETALSCGQIADAAGFGSVRRFNGHIRRVYKRTPSDLRRHRRPAASEPECYRLRLGYRPPFDWPALIDFLAARATPGVERVDASGYRRTISFDGQIGTIAVSPVTSDDALMLEVRFPDPRALLAIVERVRRMFDLGADPLVISEHLQGDPLLARLFAKHPGIRVPGAWDSFELAIRAILGQQISVRAATTIAGRVASMFGSGISGDARERLFPTPAQLSRAPLERAGIVPARAEAIRSLACHVASGTIVLNGGCHWAGVDSVSLGNAETVLGRLPGIGPWTAQYIAMRALGEPDAFPSGDLVLRRMTGARTAGELEKRSETWRPWRAYAVMLLWQRATHA